MAALRPPPESFYSPFPLGQFRYPQTTPAPPRIAAQNPPFMSGELVQAPPRGPTVSVLAPPGQNKPGSNVLGMLERFGPGLQMMGLGLAAQGLQEEPTPIPVPAPPIRGNPQAIADAQRFLREYMRNSSRGGLLGYR